MRGKKCTIIWCEKPISARVYCGMHNSRLEKGKDMEAPPQKTPRTGACSINQCERPVDKRRLCALHYNRAIKGLDIEAPIAPRCNKASLNERMDFYTAATPEPNGCIRWTGKGRTNGYGQVYDPEVRRQRPAHVVAWEKAHDRKVPAGMVIRHTCDNRECVNPDHLLIGTQSAALP